MHHAPIAHECLKVPPCPEAPKAPKPILDEKVPQMWENENFRLGMHLSSQPVHLHVVVSGFVTDGAADVFHVIQNGRTPPGFCHFPIQIV